MSSEFFNQLVDSRRNGTAPGQEPASTGGEETIPVPFYPAPFDGLSTCGRCHALLVTQHTPSHADWHRLIGS